MEEIQYLWSDKKRYLGMPISFTEYSLSPDRLFIRRGIFTVTYDQTTLDRVQDIKVSINVGQWFFGVGTVTILSNDKNMPEIKLENIRNPLFVKEKIHKEVERIRKEKNIKPNEVMT